MREKFKMGKPKKKRKGTMVNTHPKLHNVETGLKAYSSETTVLGFAGLGEERERRGHIGEKVEGGNAEGITQEKRIHYRVSHGGVGGKRTLSLGVCRRGQEGKDKKKKSEEGSWCASGRRVVWSTGSKKRMGGDGGCSSYRLCGHVTGGKMEKYQKDIH